MTKIIVAATAIYGHVAPMLTITEDLLARGHEVVFLTGSAFAADVERTGAVFEPLEGAADIDAALFASPERHAVEGHERAHHTRKDKALVVPVAVILVPLPGTTGASFFVHYLAVKESQVFTQ